MEAIPDLPQCDATVYNSERAEMVSWCSASLQTNDEFNIPVRRLLKLLRVSRIPQAIREIEHVLKLNEHYVRRADNSNSASKSKNKRKHKPDSCDAVFVNLKGALMYAYWLNAQYRYKRASQICTYLYEVCVYESRTIAIIAEAMQLARLDDLQITVPAITKTLVAALKQGAMPCGRELLWMHREATEPGFQRPAAAPAQLQEILVDNKKPKFVVVNGDDPNDVGE